MLKAEGVVDVEEEDGLSKTFDLSEQQINKLWGYATMIVRFTSVTEDYAMNFDYQDYQGQGHNQCAERSACLLRIA